MTVLNNGNTFKSLSSWSWNGKVKGWAWWDKYSSKSTRSWTVGRGGENVYKKRRRAIGERVEKNRERKSRQERARERERELESFSCVSLYLNPSYVLREHCSFIYESLILSIFFLIYCLIFPLWIFFLIF